MSAEKYPEHKKRNLLLSDRISQNSVKNIIENIFEINEDDGQADTMQQDWTRLTDGEIRYAIPEYFGTIVDVERAIELAIEDLKNDYEIDVLEIMEKAIVESDAILYEQISLFDAIALKHLKVA